MGFLEQLAQTLFKDDRYPDESYPEDSEDDDGTMPGSRDDLAAAVVGHKIVSVEKGPNRSGYGYGGQHVITLDNGTQVLLADQDDCCAHTSLEAFLLHPEMVDHVILGVGTTGEFSKWHIYADLGDVLELEVGWSCGNPFYYGYGFHIQVLPIGEEEDVD
jgi:hypothetical protein